jgi:DNA mismatch repair protein MutS
MPPEIDEKDLTPLMRQYLAIKRKHGDSLLFYRMGDFYEMFWEDAEVAARELNITLTARDKGPYGGKIPLAGIPHHALDNYLPRLVKKGYKVAIAEQVEDPKKAKGIVKRDVIRVVTPGTMVSAGDGAEEGNNYLTAVMRMVKNGASPDLPMAQEKGSSQERICLPSASYGLAHLDVSTGEFHATEISDENPFQRLISELMNISPAEIIIPKSLSEKKDFMDEMRVRIGTGIPITAFPDHFFLENYASDLLKEQFGVISLEGSGLLLMRGKIRCAIWGT